MYFASVLTLRGDILRFYSISSECLWTTPCTHVVMVIRGLTLQPTFYLSLDDGIVFVGFLSYRNIKKYVMTISESYVEPLIHYSNQT